MYYALEVVAWVVGLVRAALVGELHAVPVFVGPVDESFAPPYVAVRLQSDTARDETLCDSPALDEVIVQVSLWHTSLGEAARLSKIVEVALQGAAKTTTLDSDTLHLTHLRRVSSAILTETAPQRPRRATSNDLEGARAVLHRAATLWRCDARIDSPE